MTAPVVVPDRPVLVTIPQVELIHAGTWHISTGEWTVTSDDLYAAVAALDCPAVRRPVLKLGHDDPRFSGEPAIGYIDAMAVSEGGVQLVGDYAGIPQWLADVMASAYPDRSVEGEYGFRCQLGHTHPFVVTAVALLGVEAPGVGTLQSIQDIAALYNVAATGRSDPDSDRVTITVAGEETAMPRRPTTVAASATVEDVRRSFYEGPAAENWWWIEDLFLDPLEVIAIDDEDGRLWRVPFTVAADSTVSWGEPQEVRREYVAASVAARTPLMSWASRAESRPLVAGSASSGPPPGEPPSNPERSGTVDVPDEQLATLRRQLGLPDDADMATIIAANQEALNERADPPPAVPPTPPVSPPALPEGTVAVDATQLEQLQVAARRGEEARARQEREDREQAVAAAVRDGRIAPARRDHWVAQLAVDPGAATVLAGLAPGLVPVEAERGYDAPPDPGAGDNYWFPGTATVTKAG